MDRQQRPAYQMTAPAMNDTAPNNVRGNHIGTIEQRRPSEVLAAAQAADIPFNTSSYPTHHFTSAATTDVQSDLGLFDSLAAPPYGLTGFSQATPFHNIAQDQLHTSPASRPYGSGMYGDLSTRPTYASPNTAFRDLNTPYHNQQYQQNFRSFYGNSVQPSVVTHSGSGPSPYQFPYTRPQVDSVPHHNNEDPDDDDYSIHNAFDRRECIRCSKLVPRKLAGDLCRRCQQKHAKNNAGPPSIPLILMSAAEASDVIHAPQAPLLPESLDEGRKQIVANDLEDHTSFESTNMWLQKLVQAINSPYQLTSEQATVVGRNIDQHNALLKTQMDFNKKFHDQPKQYDNIKINARIRLLWDTVIALYTGGRLPYDDGGDNSGYNVNSHLLFSERLRQICDMLELDKRICIDVIEGRGVNAFTRDPHSYEKRKQDNITSNSKKSKAAKAREGVKVDDNAGQTAIKTESDDVTISSAVRLIPDPPRNGKVVGQKRKASVQSDAKIAKRHVSGAIHTSPTQVLGSQQSPQIVPATANTSSGQSWETTPLQVNTSIGNTATTSHEHATTTANTAQTYPLHAYDYGNTMSGLPTSNAVPADDNWSTLTQMLADTQDHTSAGGQHLDPTLTFESFPKNF